MHHIVHIVVSDAGLCLRVLFLAHVLVLCGYVGTLVTPIVGTAAAQEAEVVLQYTLALLVPRTPTVAEPFHMMVGLRMVG